MTKIAIATLALLTAGLAHADYGDMHLYQLAGINGAPTLRVTEMDSVTLTVQQCDKNGVGCGQPQDFKRQNSKVKEWSFKYIGNELNPDTVKITAKGNLIFTTTPFSLVLDDDEAKKASLLRAVYRPR